MVRIIFKNKVEGSFFDYLLGRGYARSTAKHYISKLRKIEPLDSMVNSDVEAYIDDYENGAHKAENLRSHKASSNALKRFKEYLSDKGLI